MKKRRELTKQEAIRRQMLLDAWDDARIKGNWTQQKLADAMGKSQSAVQAWLLGVRPLPVERYEQIMQVLQPTKKHNQTRGVPLLALSQVQAYLGQGLARIERWWTTGAATSDSTFAVRMEGTAMTNSEHKLCVLDQDVVIIQADRQPEPRQLVLVQAGGETLIREYLREGGIEYAAPVSPRFQITELKTDDRILGVGSRIEREI